MATIKQSLTIHKDNQEQLKALAYIQHLSSMTNAEIARWNITSLFGKTDSENEIVTDRKIINKLFFQRYQETIDKKVTEVKEDDLVESTPGLSESIDDYVKNNVSYRKRRLDNEIDSYQRDVRSMYSRIERTMQSIAQKNIELLTIADGGATSKIKNELNEVLKEGCWVNPFFQSGFLYLNTRNKIILSHENKAASLDIKLDVGQLAVKMSLSTFEMTVIPYKDNIRTDGFFHPHVDSDGHICWGDAVHNVTNWKGSFEFAKVFKVLYSLLHNYNPDNPYISIQRMNTHNSKYGRCSENLRHPNKNPKPQTPSLSEATAVEVIATSTDSTNVSF